MAIKKKTRQTYFELAEHNTLQISVFMILLISGTIICFYFALPFIEFVIVDFLNGEVYNSGEEISYMKESAEPVNETSYLFSWAIDIYLNTPQESRYWFNPALSLSLPSAIFGLAIAVGLTSLLPQNLGYMRQKIEREIVNQLDKILLLKKGYHSDEGHEEILDELLHADLRDLHEYEQIWGISIEDLKILSRGIRWQHEGLLYKLFHLNDGFIIYMRFHFTLKYTNAVLGLVYVGAAVLIIIIGMRGLKFIPSSQPSLVFFALGLEFTLLITYAISLMYSREEDESSDYGAKTQSASSDLLMNSDFGNSKDVENLLRVFIRQNEKNKEQGP